MTETRRLAAIMAADVAGYTRLMEADESGTLQRLKEHQAAIFPIGQEHGGRIVGTAGDGLLVEFPSVVEAVRAAMRMQALMAERNEDIPTEERMLFRIGINLGDVIVGDDGDIFGTGVNVAARLEGLATPGGLCISQSAHEQVRDLLDFQFENAGEVAVKNISRPIHTWRWPSGGATTVPSFSSMESLATPSIAVLPFENMSGDPDQQYFSDGITEDIITDLYRSNQLTVIARNSSFLFRGPDHDIDEVGKELGARYLLKGSVRKIGSRVRVTAQLIYTATGEHIWADRYDRDLEDIFAIQDEITACIFSALFRGVLDYEQGKSRQLTPELLSAQDHYWRGTWHYAKMTREDSDLGREAFLAALANHPDHVNAHAWLSYLEVNAAWFGWAESADLAVQSAHFHANRACELDNGNADALLAIVTVQFVLRDWDNVEENCHRALDIAPSYAAGHFLLGAFHSFAGEARLGVERLLRAVSLSPRDLIFFYFANVLSVANYRLGEYSEAEAWALRSTQHNSNFPFAHFNLAAARAQLGNAAGAERSLSEAKRLIPDHNLDFFYQGWPYRDSGDLERLLEGIRKAGLEPVA